MKYFGIVNKKKFLNLTETEKVDFLIKNNLFYYTKEKNYFEEGHIFDFKKFNSSIRFNIEAFFIVFVEFLSMVKKNGFKKYGDKKKDYKNELFYYSNAFENCIMLFLDDNDYSNAVKIEPNQDLVDEFYNFIIEKYKFKISFETCNFYEKFNEDIFGLTQNKQKKIALKYYKKTYNSLFRDKGRYLTDYEATKEPNDFNIDNKLNVVIVNKLKYQDSLINLNSYFEFLYGSKSHFEDDFYAKNKKIIDPVIAYESQKQIMIDLNEKFNIEQNNEIYIKEEIKPFRDFIRHDRKIEIEKIIQTHYSNLKGVSLRYLIEFLIERRVLFLNYGDKTKLWHSLKVLFKGNDIAEYTSIFDKKVFKKDDQNYKLAKESFALIFKDIL